MSGVLVTAEQRAIKLAANNQETMVKFGNALKEKAIALTADLLPNYPEYNSEWIASQRWDATGQTHTFHVEDPDNEGDFKVTEDISHKEVANCIPLMFMMVVAGQVNVGLDVESFWDPCNWDADAIDVLMQLFFYGEIVFG